MTPRLFDKRPSFHLPPTAQQDSPGEWSDDREEKGRAVEELSEQGVLSRRFGVNGEYEVRTTVNTAQGWQYQCGVLHHGEAIKDAFLPIVVDRTRQMQDARRGHADTTALRLDFVREAVDMHVVRCAALREYLMLSSIYSQAPRKARSQYPLLVTLIGVAFLMTYGIWKSVTWTAGGQPSIRAVLPVQMAQHPVIDQPQAARQSNVPIPMGNGAASRNSTEEPGHVPAITGPPETPKAVQLADLLALQPERVEVVGASPDLSNREVVRQVQRQLIALGFNPGPVDGDLGRRTETALLAYQRAYHLLETGRLDEVTFRSLVMRGTADQADRMAQADTARLASGATAPDVQVGDLLHLGGWLHQVSRDPDGAYRLQVSPSQKRIAPGLMAVVPHSTHAARSATMQAQLETVRAFITERLLRDQEPSSRGSVMRSPIFVELTGRLSSVDPPLSEPPQRKGLRDTTPPWEVRPVLDLQFATPPPPLSDARR